MTKQTLINIVSKKVHLTKKAVKEFQAQNNLKVDGKVGSKTWKRLEPHLYASSQSAAAPAGN